MYIKYTTHIGGFICTDGNRNRRKSKHEPGERSVVVVVCWGGRGVGGGWEVLDFSCEGGVVVQTWYFSSMQKNQVRVTIPTSVTGRA